MNVKHIAANCGLCINASLPWSFPKNLVNTLKTLFILLQGYVMGLACTAESVDKTAEEIKAMGLQSPHAYGFMEAREIEVSVVDDKTGQPTGAKKMEKLVKLRNPWGDRSPVTWKGDYGKDSKKWVWPLQWQLGYQNKDGVSLFCWKITVPYLRKNIVLE